MNAIHPITDPELTEFDNPAGLGRRTARQVVGSPPFCATLDWQPCGQFMVLNECRDEAGGDGSS